MRGRWGLSSLAGRAVEPFLRAEGISSPDAIVATQAAMEHANALPDLFRRYRPPVVLCSGHDAEFSVANYNISALFWAASAGRGEGARAARGDRLALGGAVTCEVLWPPGGAAASLPAGQAGLIFAPGVRKPHSAVGGA